LQLVVEDFKHNDTVNERQRRITIRAPHWFGDTADGNVVPVSVDVGDVTHRLRTQWMDRPPQRCTRGHWLLPGHMIVATIACSCGPHISWECECGAATYEPELIESCSLVTGLRRS